MKLTSVKHIGGYSLNVIFEDDVKGEIDLSELVNKGIFQTLKDITQFKKAYSTGYSIAWTDDLEIDALNIYLQLTRKNLHETELLLNWKLSQQHIALQPIEPLV